MPKRTTTLPPGLQSIDAAAGRSVAVIDRWSGQIWRVPAARWRRLCGDGGATESDLAAARAAGWLDGRRAAAARSPWSLVSIQTPIVLIAPLARWLAPIAALWLHPLTATAWLALGLWTMAIGLGRGDGLLGSAAAPSPLWLAATFLMTKTAHELGHAAAAVRMGCTPGKLGLWWIAGAPCPYIDVSSVWRLPTRWRRAVVMGAGMWTEIVLGIVAMGAALTTASPAVQTAAMHVVAVAGISTVLFNANPLMRYDGYYLLSDWLDTTDLRRDGRDAWAAWWRGDRWAGPRWLPAYHVAGAAYRWFVQIMIAAVAVHLAGWVGLTTLAMVAVSGAAVLKTAAMIRNGGRFLVGQSTGPRDRPILRWGGSAAIVGLLAAALWVPTPRYATVPGTLHLADVREVHPPASGRVVEILVAAGDRVVAGQPIARFEHLPTSLAAIAAEREAINWRRRVERASRRTLAAGKSSNDAPPAAAMIAAATAAADRADRAAQKRDELSVVAPIDGLVLPPPPTPWIDDGLPQWMGDFDAVGYQTGQLAGAAPICRIASSPRWVGRFEIDAQTASIVGPSAVVRIVAQTRRDLTITATDLTLLWPAESVAQRSPRDPRQPARSQPLRLVGSFEWVANPMTEDGSSATAVIHLPARALWRDLWAGAKSLVGW